MPNFDGTGPLKRGRVIGRGLGTCKTCDDECQQKARSKKPVAQERRAD
ncbi:MAG: DUF5320 domain-containing protein [Methanoregula sp.]